MTRKECDEESSFEEHPKLDFSGQLRPIYR
jgi:hypothetical protein